MSSLFKKASLLGALLFLSGCADTSMVVTFKNQASETINTLSVGMGDHLSQFKHIAASNSVTDKFAVPETGNLDIEIEFASGKTQHWQLEALAKGPHYSHSFSVTDSGIELTDTLLIGSRL